MSRRLQAGVLSLGLTVALTAVLVPAATAAKVDPTGDCYAHGALTQTYTAAELRQALQTMSPTVKEYTSCSDVLQAALLKQVGGGGGSVGSAGHSGSGGSFLPTPLIVILVLLALAGVTFGALAIRRRGGGPRGEPGGETG
jgi:hypothetical protein